MQFFEGISSKCRDGYSDQVVSYEKIDVSKF